MKFKITATPTQYFVISGLAALTGLLLIAISLREVYAVAKEHPAVNVYVMGFVLLLIAGSMFANGRYLRDIGRLQRNGTEGTK